MEGFVIDYNISNTAIKLVVEEKQKIKVVSIPMHGVVDIVYTKGDTNVGFQEMTANTKTAKFKNSEHAEEFYNKVNTNWFNL